MSVRKLLACAAAAAVVPVALAAAPASAAAGCRVAYSVTNQWQGGFGTSVAITNLGDAVNGWNLTFTFPSGQSISQLWNGTYIQSGGSVTVKDAGYNGAIATNTSTSFGFNATLTGANTAPSAFSLNGVACTGAVSNPTPGPTPTTTNPPPPADRKLRVMPLGDSITGSPGCWRALLWQRLQQSLPNRVDFVGTLPAQGCGFSYDGDNEGHGGFLATNVADQNQLPPWLSATKPDIVLMHFGTNDVWNNRSPATILAAFTKLVGQMRASNPAMRIIVAQILPMAPSNCSACGQRVVDFNRAIPGWAASTSTAASPITVVDQWTGFSTSADTVDGVHPDDSGNQKMSDRWYPALAAALS